MGVAICYIRKDNGNITLLDPGGVSRMLINFYFYYILLLDYYVFYTVKIILCRHLLYSTDH